MNDYYDLTLYIGPGHGWLKAPYTLLVDLGIEGDISDYSYMDRAGNVYLEEDADLSKFYAAARERDDCVIRTYTKNIENENVIRQLARYHPIPVRELTVRLSLEVLTTGSSTSDLMTEYENDPVAFVERLVRCDWVVESLEIDDDGPAEV